MIYFSLCFAPPSILVGVCMHVRYITSLADSSVCDEKGKLVQEPTRYAGRRIRTARVNGSRVVVVLAGQREVRGEVLIFASPEAYEASIQRVSKS